MEAVVVVDDDGSDVEVVSAQPGGVVDLTGGGGGAASTGASVPAAADASTATGLRGATHRRRKRKSRRRRDDEVRFVGSSNVARAASSEISRGGASSSVQYVGTKRSRPSAAPATAHRPPPAARPVQSRPDNFFNNPTNLTTGVAGSGIMRSFDSFARFLDGGVFGSGGSGTNAFDEPLRVGMINRMRSFGNRPVGPPHVPENNAYTDGDQWKRKSPRKSAAAANTGKEEASKAMTKGRAIQRPTGFDSIDMHYPRLRASDRTLVLRDVLASIPNGSEYTKKFVHEWRVKYERGNPRATLWSLAKALSEEVTSVRKMPARKAGEGARQKENIPICNNASRKEYDADEDGYAAEKKATASIGPLTDDVLDTLKTYFCAHVERSRHQAMLDAIEPTESQSGLTCSICSDDFDPSDTVVCTGENIHFYCRPCLNQYCTVTVQSGPIQSMVCPMPSCKSLFATDDIRSTLSRYDILMIEHREEGRDRRVALAAKAMLHCECGTVAIVTEEDMGDGRIACPGIGCGRRYCAKCGNEDHGKDGTCPPPAETVQWLSKHSKPCPNCNNPIEKNGGCDHMTCRPPGGCGHEFWYSCGCPYRGQHKCGRSSRFPGPW
ncbi:hypothetical protein ACHAWF_005594 [Thalassiosira exigua]